MAQQSGLKGNPASKRMGNDKLKAKRARSWERGQNRKAARRRAQAERERINREHKEKGLSTPAETRYQHRKAYRDVVAFLHKAYGRCSAFPLCVRPKGHKGHCGNLTQTEIRQAGKMAAALAATPVARRQAESKADDALWRKG